MLTIVPTAFGSETSFVVFEIFLLIRSIVAAQDHIPVRKSSEPFNYRQVVQGIFVGTVAFVIDLSGFYQPEFLHLQILCMPQWEVKYGSLLQ